jgi:hypothetical protein
MCACQGTAQGDVQRDVTANPVERLITFRTVNYPEWNPGERLIIRKGFWGTDNVLDSTTQPSHQRPGVSVVVECARIRLSDVSLGVIREKKGICLNPSPAL